MEVLAILAGALVGAASNRYAGWEHGNRYLPAVIIALLLGLNFGLEAAFFGFVFLLWRSIGWHKSIDMGRNEHSFVRDFATLWGITFLPLASAAVFFPTWNLVWVSLIPPLVYTAVMRGLPWRPEFKHIATAEIITGALVGGVTVALFI
jgi:hypothetical protein